MRGTAAEGPQNAPQTARILAGRRRGSPIVESRPLAAGGVPTAACERSPDCWLRALSQPRDDHRLVRGDTAASGGL
jgi:hypothetical protein